MHTRKTMYLSPIKLCDLTSKGLFDCNSDFIAIALDNGGIKVIGQASIDLWFHNERVIDLSLQDLGNKLSSISLGKLCITDLN